MYGKRNPIVRVYVLPHPTGRTNPDLLSAKQRPPEQPVNPSPNYPGTVGLGLAINRLGSHLPACASVPGSQTLHLAPFTAVS